MRAQFKCTRERLLVSINKQLMNIFHRIWDSNVLWSCQLEYFRVCKTFGLQITNSWLTKPYHNTSKSGKSTAIRYGTHVGYRLALKCQLVYIWNQTYPYCRINPSHSLINPDSSLYSSRPFPFNPDQPHTDTPSPFLLPFTHISGQYDLQDLQVHTIY